MPNIVWPPKEWDSILAEFGRIIFNFNSLEGGMHAIFAKIATANWQADQDRLYHRIIASHMGNVALCDALRTVTNERAEAGTISKESVDLIEHCIKTFDLTREYRNHYVHGFNGILSNDKKEYFAGIHTFSARKYFLESFDQVSISDLSWLSSWCYSASHFVAESHLYISHSLSYRVSGGSPPILPAKWALPSKLTKRPTRYRHKKDASE